MTLDSDNNSYPSGSLAVRNFLITDSRLHQQNNDPISVPWISCEFIMNTKKIKDLSAITENGAASNATYHRTYKIRDKVGVYLLSELCTDYEVA